jgi:potassium/hydrogen antiporter
VTLDSNQLNLSLLVASAVILVAILAVRISVRAGLPSLLLYLLLGVLLGESVLGFNFDDAVLAQSLAYAALIVILAEGGVTTPWSDFKPSAVNGALLASVGVFVTIGVMAALAHYVLGLNWQLSVLLAAITAPTDAAAVFSVLRRVPLPKRIVGQLEAESGLNDAPSVLIVIAASQQDFFQQPAWQVGGLIGYQLFTGLLVGLAVGFAGAWVMRRVALPSSGLYPLSVLALCVLAYGVAAVPLVASGFAAVYVAGVVLGNSELPHRTTTRSFVEGLGWLSQIGLFIMLGLLISPSEVTRDSIVIALVGGTLLALVARPLSVAAAIAWRKVALADLTFISWAGLRGSVPIILSTIPLAAGVDGARTLFDVVFVLVVIDTLVTAPTLPWVARRLRLLDSAALRDLEIEAAPLDRIAVDLLQIRVTRASRLHGVEVGELRLPEGASVTLVVREGHTFVPGPRTVVAVGDELLVVTPRAHRAATESRLRAVSLRGRLATWLE